MSNDRNIVAPAGSLMSMVLYPDHVRMTVPGAPAPKDVAIPDAMALLSSGLAQSISLPAMDLPFGAIRVATGPTQIQMCIYTPGKVHEVKHTNGETYTVPFPHIVFNVTLVKKTKDGNEIWSITNFDWSATNLDVNQVRSLRQKFPNFSNTPEHFCKLPLPNIYSEGKVCFGNNTMPYDFSDSSMAGLQYWVDFLHRTPFNNDLSVPHRGNAPSTASSYLSWLHGKPVFPYEILGLK